MEYVLLFLIVCLGFVVFLTIPSKSVSAVATRTETKGADVLPTRKPENVAAAGDLIEKRPEAPYIQTPINSVDDYEYNLIFQNEGDKEITRAEMNRLQSQYPLDWSSRPPNSAQFQQGVQELRTQQATAIAAEGFQDTATAATTLSPYKEMEAAALAPPDTSAAEMSERKILQTYKPNNITSLTSYDLDDAKTLISKIYDAKGLIPSIIQKEPNVYEVIGTRRKDEKIIYEDEESPASTGAVQTAGEATITVPPTAMDVAVGLDPFYSPNPSSRTNRWDYTKWTPGLERTFAPTFATEKWY